LYASIFLHPGIIDKLTNELIMKKRQIGTLVFGLLIIFCFIQCKSTQEKDIKTELDSYFKQQVNQCMGINEDITPGLSVIITKKDSILYKGSFGFANLDKELQITENTVFDIASASKQFTGMAIALLEEKGLINIDDKIINYLPDLPEAMSEITIYQLVHHTSGIRDWPNLFALKGWQPEEPLTLNDICEILNKQEGLNFAPGTEFSYSNSNYNLLAKIIEAVTDTAFEDWMCDNIFAPLGMENTYYVESSSAEETTIADSYVYNGNNFVPFTNTLNAPGSSSLMSNTLDMSKCLINFNTKSLGEDGVFNKITQKGKLSDGKNIDYGYGLYITKIKNKTTYAHDGAWGGYRSATAFFPEENIGVVVLSNNGTINPNKIMNDIVDILFFEAKKEASDKSEIMEQEINDEFFALCAGNYEQVDDKGCYLTFFKEDDAYYLNMYDKDFQLYAKSDSVFFVKEADAEFVFHLRNGEVNSHTLKQNGNSYLALRVDESKKDSTIINYDKLSGTFYSKELDIEYEIKYLEDDLRIQSSIFSNDIILKHSEDNTFTSNSGLIQSVSFLEENGCIMSLVINNGRVRNLLFEKVSQ